MAAEEHLKILNQGVNAWNEWRQRNTRIRPDLTNADLSHVNLSNVDFTHVDLSCAYLIHINLSSARLLDTNFSRANLSFADILGANLVGANFSHTKLYSANLQSADLSNTDFSFANLLLANLVNTNLSNANLSNADLTRTNFAGADLSDVNLTHAKLFYTNLSNAILENADFGSALLNKTIFGSVNLKNVKNLDLCEHKGPSLLNHETIINSGRLAELFLRGCGLPEDFINYIPSLFWAPKAIEFYSCFISYSHSDKSFARRVHDTLQGRGIRCWLDERQMLPGDDIYEQIDHGIRMWDKVLLCCSKDSLSSWWVDNEINKAFEKERQLFKDRGKKVLALIPLNLDSYIALHN